MKSSWMLRTVIIGIAVVLIFSMIVMALWNWLIPVIFHGPRLNIWQSAGLLILCKILFGGIGPGNWNGQNQSRKKHWKEKFNEKWSCLSSEKEKHAQSNAAAYHKGNKIYQHA